MRIRLSTIAGFFCVLLSGCSEGSIKGSEEIREGQLIFAKECSACHGVRGKGAGSPSLAMGIVAPDLTGIKQRNGGYFPREFVSRFIMGRLEKEDPFSAMPDFSTVGLRHVYPNGGADGEVLETDFANLLDYLEAIQE
ncbi:c-type cytochrome [Sulfitobacter sp. M39]|uniref:c-type cytochrome n=1 Tax=Sulfitobacter sp. M39 TaxID=2675334 RepID=UPI001F27ED64|nr:cytochrome c [Sulfitobacter sp. M39]MCF7747141.1 c-type cytochrome [Sulfitobacter sp. M39]